jgi:4-hydroxy-4-methyl-2-oxoglutarate aldolase
MGFPARSRGVSAQGTGKTGPGPVTAPAMVTGTAVRRGDVIVADDDGVPCVPLLRHSHTLGHRRRDHKKRKSRPAVLDNSVQNSLGF